MGDIHPQPLGTVSDPVWQKQEQNAEASDFVVHEHEFAGNTAKLNAAGESHVKEIALRVSQTPDLPFPVLVERSSMSTRPGDKYSYAVHNDSGLDMSRRQVIVSALQSMGVNDAEQRVVVGAPLTPGFQLFEGNRAYSQGMGQEGGGSSGAAGGAGFF